MIFRIFLLLYTTTFIGSTFTTMQCGKPLNTNKPMARIVGGYDVGYYKYSWMATLMKDGQVFCGGSLIGPRTVVTAAHCYKEYLTLAKHGDVRLEDVYTVKLGVYNVCTTESTQKEFKVQKVLVHELYETKRPYYDVCLLTLNGDTGPFVPLCLPKTAYESSSRPKEATIVGYGSLKYAGDSPCTLREARILIYTDEACKEMIESTGNNVSDFKNALCAGYLAGGIDACQGDSGGPLQILGPNSEYVLLGLTSFGYQCAAPGLLGVYTDVSHYLDWIAQHSCKNSTTAQTNTTIKPVATTKPPDKQLTFEVPKPPSKIIIILDRKGGKKATVRTKTKRKGFH